MVLEPSPCAIYNGLFLWMCNQILCNLHSIERSALLYLVTYNPHQDTVGVRDVLADATYIYRVLASKEKRHRVNLLLGAVHEYETLALGNGATYLLNAQWAFCLNPQ